MLLSSYSPLCIVAKCWAVIKSLDNIIVASPSDQLKKNNKMTGKARCSLNWGYSPETAKSYHLPGRSWPCHWPSLCAVRQHSSRSHSRCPPPRAAGYTRRRPCHPPLRYRSRGHVGTTAGMMQGDVLKLIVNSVLTNRQLLSGCQLCRHWWHRGVVVSTTLGATSDDNVSIMTTV